ncbi:hypothetical protein C8R43DRAFT_993864, partial [Mycena crocata]
MQKTESGCILSLSESLTSTWRCRCTLNVDSWRLSRILEFIVCLSCLFNSCSPTGFQPALQRAYHASGATLDDPGLAWVLGTVMMVVWSLGTKARQFPMIFFLALRNQRILAQ